MNPTKALYLSYEDSDIGRKLVTRNVDNILCDSGGGEEELQPRLPTGRGGAKMAVPSSVGKSVKQCQHCQYSTVHRHVLDRHEQTVHERSKVFQCEICEYKTGHSSAFKRHTAKVHDRSKQPVFTCENCQYQTIHKSALKRHTANVHHKSSLVSYKCSVCDYTTTYEFALDRHISTVHLKEGPLGCYLCDYSTVHKQSLERHIKIVHDREQNLSCESCDFRTAHRAALKMHIATVHDSRAAFRCEKCGFETLYKTALARHRATVNCQSGVKIFGASNLMKQENQERIAKGEVTNQERFVNSQEEEEEEEVDVNWEEGQKERRGSVIVKKEKGTRNNRVHCVIISTQEQEQGEEGPLGEQAAAAALHLHQGMSAIHQSVPGDAAAEDVYLQHATGTANLTHFLAEASGTSVVTADIDSHQQL